MVSYLLAYIKTRPTVELIDIYDILFIKTASLLLFSRETII